MGECFFSGTGSPGYPGQRAGKRLLLLFIALESCVKMSAGIMLAFRKNAIHEYHTLCCDEM